MNLLPFHNVARAIVHPACDETSTILTIRDEDDASAARTREIEGPCVRNMVGSFPLNVTLNCNKEAHQRYVLSIVVE